MQNLGGDGGIYFDFLYGEKNNKGLLKALHFFQISEIETSKNKIQ